MDEIYLLLCIRVLCAQFLLLAGKGRKHLLPSYLARGWPCHLLPSGCTKHGHTTCTSGSQFVRSQYVWTKFIFYDCNTLYIIMLSQLKFRWNTTWNLSTFTPNSIYSTTVSLHHESWQ
jgi:hypothetical protein